MARIFICYRREDSAGHAGRLYDRLRAQFGDDVFMDIAGVGPGVDYAELIAETIDSVEAVIVVIGRHWLDADDGDGRRRLDAPDDLVRHEISEALARQVLVIPLLVQGALLPEPDELPPELRGLARRNAFEVSDARWGYDTDRLVRTLEERLGHRRSRAKAPSVSAPTILTVTGSLLVFVFGLVVRPTWHDEQIAFRISAALVLVAWAAVGLWATKWTWVIAAGGVGLSGFGLWLLLLLGSHDVADLLSIETDGITNAVVFAGSALVLVGGGLGSRLGSGKLPRVPRPASGV